MARSTTNRIALKMSATAIGYAAPWMMWCAFLPLAIIFSLMASRNTISAFGVAGVILVGGGYLLWMTWQAYSARDQRMQINAGVTTLLGLLWLYGASAFGLFHRPDVDVWPEVWRIFEYALRSFTVPVWFAWFCLMVVTSVVWNSLRVARPKKEEGENAGQLGESELDKALDGATIKVDAVVGEPDAPVLKGKIKGVPGKHVGADQASLSGKVESQHGLRMGAVRIVADPDKASDAQITVMPVDPHKDPKPWQGPSAPGAWINEIPIPFGPHTDGEEASIHLAGDDESGRPNQHVAVSGMTGAGKTGVLKVIAADGLTRRGFELMGADISGKIWQTFGVLMPYVAKIAGLNGTSDEDMANNVLDAMELLDYVKRDAMDRQQRWGKLGINQWEPRCYEEFGDPFRMVVLEEAPNLLREMGEEVVDLARLLRSAGYMLWITAQRWDWNSVPTSLRAQMSAVFCFGVLDSRDMGMILPEDVQEALSKGSVMNTPAGWQNNTAGKCIAAIGGMSPARRSDPVRTRWATNNVLAEHLAEHAVRLWSVQEIEDMKNGTFPEGILVRTKRADVHSDVRTNVSGVRTERGNVRTQKEDEEFPVYVDPELANVQADPREPVRMDPGTNDTLDDIGLEPAADANVTTEEFRAVVQQHLASLLAQGKKTCGPSDVLHMQPPTGRNRQHIAKELRRLAEKAASTEVSTIPPDHPNGSGKAGVYKLVPPREVPQELVMSA